MLQSISDRAQGWLTWIIFSILIVPFALWGINHYFDGERNLPVATVNGEEVSAADFQRIYKQHQQRLQQMFAGMDLNKLDQGVFKQQALNQLIDSVVLQQSGRKLGMRIADSQISQSVNGIEAFRRDGKFAQDLYERQLISAGYTPGTFEEQMRRDLLSEAMHNGVANTSFVTPGESDRLARLRSQKRDLVYFNLPVEPVKAGLKLSEPDIEKYFNDNKARYMTQEMVKVAYVDLSLDELAKLVQADDAGLHNYYDAHVANFTVAEQRSASHVLIQVAKDADEKTVEAARKQAEGYTQAARKGEAFDKIAKEHSDDPGSKTEGGQLGFFGRGAMDPAFEKAAFALKPGEISDPVRSSFGFHVIRLNEIKAGSVKTFDEVKKEVDVAYRKEQAEKLYFDRAERLANAAFEHPDTLEFASKELDLPIKETALFTRAGNEDEIAKNAKFTETAFSAQVLEENANSEPVEVAENRTVVMHLKERKLAEQRKLEEVHKEIVEALTAERARAEVADRGTKLLSRLQAGEDRDKLAAQEKLKWEQANGVEQDAGNVNRALLRTAFTVGHPEPGKPLYGSIAIPGTGDYAVFGVLAVHEGEPAKQDEKTKLQTKEALDRSATTADWRDYVAQLRARADVTTFNERL
jgi:peptidyl-prolyl cis-trans isomerase D